MMTTGRDEVPIVSLTRRTCFSAASFLYSTKLTDEENRSTYPKSISSSGTGHNYTVEVTVSGPVNPLTGIVMDVLDLQRAMNDGIIAVMDHKYLNRDVPYFEDVVPTVENVAIFIWKQMERELKEYSRLLRKVKVWSSDKNCVVYHGGITSLEVPCRKV